jgi:hypothetical protein
MTDATEMEDPAARASTISNTTTNTLLIETTENEETYKAELQLWMQRGSAYLFFFIILQISILTALPKDLSLIPLMILDLKILFFGYFYSIQTNLFRFLLSKDTLHQIFSFIFKSMLLLYKNFHFFNAMMIPIPIFFAFLNQFFHKIDKTQECRYLAWLVSVKQVITISEFLFLITMLNVSMSAESVVAWQPSGIIWPIYIGLCFCSVIIIGLVLFCLGSFLSWASEEISTNEFLTSFWLLGTALGATVSIIVLCVGIATPDYYRLGTYACMVPIGYLVLFIAFTQGFMKKICEWWKSFFTNSQEVHNLEVTPQRTLTFQARITKTMKKAPHVLMRISSSYFKPVETPKSKPAKRTISLKHNNEDTVAEHQRSFSIPVQVEVFSPTAKDSIDKICEMCCERLCNAVIMDCGHGGICYDCSLEMWRTVGTCHMCRGQIIEVLQIEKSIDRLVKVHSTTQAVYVEEKS